MELRIVCDSSSNTYELEGADYRCVPLTVTLNGEDYADVEDLNLDNFYAAMSLCNGPSTTSCPSPSIWLRAYEGADRVLAITLSSRLSSSYNTAQLAASEYTEQNSEAEVAVLDSRSAGEELVLLAQEAQRLATSDEGYSLSQIIERLHEYQKHTHVLFTLSDLSHLARNGRINPALARFAHTLDIHILGTGNTEGMIEILRKCRGQKKALRAGIREIQLHHYTGKKLYISHVQNEAGAYTLEHALREVWPEADITIQPCHALCSYYANLGGLIVSYVDSKTAPKHPIDQMSLPNLPINPLHLMKDDSE